MQLIRRLAKRFRLRTWTIAIVGRESGQRYSLDSIYRFSRQRTALAKAADLNRREADVVSDLTTFEAQRR